MTSLVASWRTALRVARREARRTKGRAALVAAMIALPVLALAFAAATNDMVTLTGPEQADRRMGTADARISWPLHRPTMQMPDPVQGVSIAGDGFVYNVAGGGGVVPEESPEAADTPGTEEELLEALPGSTVVPVRRGATMVRTPDGVGQPDAVMVDATNPLARGYIEVLDGRAPTAPREVALTKQAMGWLDVGIGDQITVVAGDTTRTSTVVGEVEFPSLLDSVLLFAYDADDEAVAEWFSMRENSWLVDAPEPIDWDQVQTLNEQGMVVASRAVFEHPPPDEDVPLRQAWGSNGSAMSAEEVALGVLVAGLALLEVVLLAGPAFAISARRRQRQLALVAANGGTPAHVRRIVLADGVVLGVLGALLGIALGVAVAFLARPWIEENISHERAGGYRVYPAALVAIAGLAVVTGVLAALVPAFITARQNVVASLQGRRGTTRSRKRWIAVGVVMIGFGGVVTYAGARGFDTTVILAGLIVCELGLVFCTPALVGLVARLGRLVPLAPRVALRDAARNRAAAAPAISAVMAAVAGSVALGMYFDSQTSYQRANHYQELPTGAVLVQFGYGDPEHAPPLPAIEQALRTTLPVVETHRVGSVVCPAGSPAGALCEAWVLLNDACPQLVTLTNTQELTRAERVAASANPSCGEQTPYGGTTPLQVDDGAAIAALSGASGDDLRRAQQTLAAGGVVVRSPLLITDGEVTLAISQPDPDAQVEPDAVPTLGPGGGYVWPGNRGTTVTLPGYLLTTAIGPGPAIISPATVTELGLASQTSMIVASTSRSPEAAEQERAQAALGSQAGLTVEHGFRSEVDQMLLVLLVASALITIGAAAVGTALAAADSRQDLSTLAAVGASPTLRRGLSVSQSWVIAGLGSILGALAGMAAGAAVVTAAGQASGEVLWPSPGPPTPVMPWSTLLITLVAVPGIAILGAGLFTRSRLPIERRL